MELAAGNAEILAGLLGEDRGEFAALMTATDAQKSFAQQEALVQSYLSGKLFSRALALAKASALELRLKLLNLVMMSATESGPYSIVKQAAVELGVTIPLGDHVKMFERLCASDWAEAVHCARDLENDFRRVAQVKLVNQLCDELRTAKAELSAAEEQGVAHAIPGLKTRCQTTEHYLKMAALLDKKPVNNQGGNQQKQQGGNQRKKQKQS